MEKLHTNGQYGYIVLVSVPTYDVVSHSFVPSQKSAPYIIFSRIVLLVQKEKKTGGRCPSLCATPLSLIRPHTTVVPISRFRGHHSQLDPGLHSFHTRARVFMHVRTCVRVLVGSNTARSEKDGVDVPLGEGLPTDGALALGFDTTLDT